MALYNEILVGRLNRYLQKLLQMKGEAPAPQLSAEIQPSLLLDAGAECRYLQGWNLGAVVQTIGPVAAQTNSFRFRVSQASNVIAVIERIVVHAVAATNVTAVTAVVPVTTDLATTSFGTPFDLRSQSRMAALPSGATNAAGFGNAWLFKSIAAGAAEELLRPNEEIPVAPGGAIQLDSSAVNFAMTVALRWRERFLEESERT